jgi:hypothetical protein
MKLRNPNLALISGGASLAYLAAGMAMQRGDRRTSYRLGAASSIAMAVAFGPRVLGRQTIQQGAFDPISNALVSLSVFHGAHCLLNVYYQERRDKDRIVP